MTTEVYAGIIEPSEALYSWQFCYLHGDAEDLMALHSEDAPDLFGSNVPMPDKEGNYLVSIYGAPAIAVIRMHYDTLSGRVALLRDTESLIHALNEKDWK